MERTTHIGAGLAAAILALCVLLCHPAAAYSDGGVEFVGITSQGSPDVSAVDPNAFVAVHFSKNVSFANHGRDPAFVEANREKIHLVDASGASVAAGASLISGAAVSEADPASVPKRIGFIRLQPVSV